MTSDEQRKAFLLALLKEKEFCLQAEHPDEERIARIDQELALYGHKAVPPHQRAARRVVNAGQHVPETQIEHEERSNGE